jgi:hypothetical protein
LLLVVLVEVQTLVAVAVLVAYLLAQVSCWLKALPTR